jgi:uncharacterized protein YbjT (DUF2867 family)
MPRTAVIAGATGLVGRECLRRLQSEYAVAISLVRRASGTGAEERVIDFERLSELSLPEDADVFCALGTTIRKAGSQAAFRKVDFEYPVALARRALECGARQFLVVSSVGAHNPRSNFYLQTKRGMEDAVASLPYQAVHIFRPSFLSGHREESRPGETIGIAVANTLSFALAGPLRRYKPVPAQSVAAAMVAAARRLSRGVHIHEYDEIQQLIHAT